MNPSTIKCVQTVAGLSFMATSLLGAQELYPPQYRPPDASVRAANVLDSVRQLDRALHTARKVRVDTTLGGLVWIEFEPSAFSAAGKREETLVTAYQHADAETIRNVVLHPTHRVASS